MSNTAVEPMAELPEITFGTLYREHHHRVLAFFLRRFDRDTAVDCAAEVFTVAWRRWEGVPSGGDAVRWLYGVCNNIARNQYRTMRRRGKLDARLSSQRNPSPTPPDVTVVDESEEARVVSALLRLRPADREILQLAAWEELPRSEIAHILGCSRHAVDQRVRRARDRLRHEYENLEPGATL